MMGDLTIKVGDAETLKVLGELADLHGQTIETEAQNLLTQAVRERARRLELLRLADKIAGMTPKDVPQTDSATLVREGREERER